MNRLLSYWTTPHVSNIPSKSFRNFSLDEPRPGNHGLGNLSLDLDAPLIVICFVGVIVDPITIIRRVYQSFFCYIGKNQIFQSINANEFPRQSSSVGKRRFDSFAEKIGLGVFEGRFLPFVDGGFV